MLLQAQSSQLKPELPSKRTTASIVPISLSDQKIEMEDEQKFQDYFLMEKSVGPRPVSENVELSVNQELIEQRQEMIVEQEETVPAFPFFQQKYCKPGKARRPKSMPKFLKIIELPVLHPLKSQMGNWFRPKRATVGLKGGADHKVKFSILPFSV